MTRILKYFNQLFFLSLLVWPIACQPQPKEGEGVLTGAEQMDHYLPQLAGKSVALLINHTSMVNQTHLLDTLLSSGIEVKVIFAPEHGFRGDQANGEKIADGIDAKTGLPIISLYGKNTKPKAVHLEGIDIVIYDIQDVGTRFYTYISSMHYMMEACAENNIQFMLLDRPNPNAHYIDGPVLESAHASFVGVHPMPIVYGMTSGELAQMIIGEQWINQSEDINMSIIRLNHWTHDTPYTLPVKPSPNLPNSQSIALYPSLCLFEGTNISVGRGTAFPFQIIGYPDEKFGTYTFTPVSIPSASKYPKHENKLCYGYDLRNSRPVSGIGLSWLISYYQLTDNKDQFFNTFFTKLAGTKKLQEQIEDGWTADKIRASWQEDLAQFKAIRKNYLLYE